MAKIMLVDDDPITQTLLKTLLEMEGFQVVLWDLGTDVISSVREETPDLIVLDVNLNEVDGFDVLRELRADAQLKKTRVIMSSGMDYDERCKQEGANGFLLKPYMPEALIALIRQMVNESS